MHGLKKSDVDCIEFLIDNQIIPSVVLIFLAIDEPINPTPIIVINFIKNFSPKFL